MWTERLSGCRFATPIRARAEKLGLELILAASFDWSSAGEAAERELARYVEKMRIARTMGVRIVNATHGAPLRTNHFTRDPPIERQIERWSKISRGRGGRDGDGPHDRDGEPCRLPVQRDKAGTECRRFTVLEGKLRHGKSHQRHRRSGRGSESGGPIRDSVSSEGLPHREHHDARRYA